MGGDKEQFSSAEDKMLLLSTLLTFSCLFTNPSLGANAAACPDSEWKDVGFLGLGCLLWSSQHTHSWEAANQFCFQRNFSFIENSAFSRDWWTSGTDWGREGRWYWTSSLTP